MPAKLGYSLQLGGSLAGFLKKAGVLDSDSRLIGDSKQKVQVLVVEGTLFLVALHGHHSHHPPRGNHRHPQPRPGQLAGGLALYLLEKLEHIFFYQNRLAGADDMTGQANPSLLSPLGTTLPPLYFDLEAHLIFLFVMEGDVEVGGVHHQADLLVDLVHQFIKLHDRTDDPAYDGESAQLRNTTLSLIEESGVLDGHGGLIGEELQGLDGPSSGHQAILGIIYGQQPQYGPVRASEGHQ